MKETLSVVEGNVAGINVPHEYSVTLKNRENRQHFAPARAKLLLFLGTPIGHHFLGKVRRLAEIRTSEIENERPAHKGHCNNPQVVVAPYELGNLTSADSLNPTLFQPKVDVSFPAKGILLIVNLDRRVRYFGLGFHQ